MCAWARGDPETPPTEKSPVGFGLEPGFPGCCTSVPWQDHAASPGSGLQSEGPPQLTLRKACSEPPSKTICDASVGLSVAASVSGHPSVQTLTRNPESPRSGTEQAKPSTPADSSIPRERARMRRGNRRGDMDTRDSKGCARGKRGRNAGFFEVHRRAPWRGCQGRLTSPRYRGPRSFRPDQRRE